MKLAIPVDECKLDSSVCVSFGRTPYFLFYNTETGEEIYFDNGAISAEAGAGIKAAQKIVDEKADALLTIRCGENAAAVLNAADISLYKTIDANAADNIDAFKAGKLSVLTEIHAGFHGGQR